MHIVTKRLQLLIKNNFVVHSCDKNKRLATLYYINEYDFVI